MHMLVLVNQTGIQKQNGESLLLIQLSLCLSPKQPEKKLPGTQRAKAEKSIIAFDALMACSPNEFHPWIFSTSVPSH